MERASSREEPEQRLTITLPQRSLLVLCGPAGSGKSTFAQRLVSAYQDRGLYKTSIVSSDYCRALVCDDEANQQVNRDTFDLFHYIIHKRMFQHRFTIADSTALQAEARYRLREVAQRHSYYTCLLIFQMSPETYLLRNRSRQRIVEEPVINYHIGLLQQTIQMVPAEGWNQFHILQEHTQVTMDFLAG